MDKEILQAIRKSHCSHGNRDGGHQCAGSCKITPKGIELTCHLCGDDKHDDVPYRSDAMYKRAKNVCLTIGMNFDNLTAHAQDLLLVELFRDYCPNCKATHFVIKDYMKCGCGWSYNQYSGWENK